MRSPDLVQRSIEVLLAGQHAGGGYLAAPTFAPYRQCWLRDGSFCAWAMSEAGHPASAEAFFQWAARAVAGQDGASYLPARFAPNGSRLDDGWWDRQHDGYGTWLWVMAAHQRRHGRLPDGITVGVRTTVEYLLRTWSRPCFDWWEGHDGHQHVATLAAVAAGLVAVDEWTILPVTLRHEAARTGWLIRNEITTRGTRDGHLVKWLDDGTSVDASLIVLSTPFGLFHPRHPLMAATLAEIERQLLHDDGVYRHPADTFYGGGRWPLLACLLGMHYVSLDRLDDARRLLSWTAAQATPDGDLPEQAAEQLLRPAERAEWLERWGEPACPLLWSHAMYLLLHTQLHGG